MVDAFMGDGGNDGWDAVPASNDASAAMQSQEPMMQMQAQDNGTDDVFADAALPVSSPGLTIITASGAAQNLDDDLTEEEKEIVRVADEYQQNLK